MSTSPLGTKAATAHDAIAALCADPPSAPELVEEVAARVRRVVPFDSGAWMTSDPDTLLPTSITKQGTSSPELGRAFTHAELLGEREPDVGSYLDLIARGQSAAGLSLLTGGDLAQARRHADVHVPFGLRDELRLVARSAGTTWALGCMSRGADVPDFSEDEVRWVGTIAEHLGHGVRRALSRAPGEGVAPRGPGMLVLAADGTVEAATGEADRWLQGLERGPNGVPVSIMTVALQAQANATGRGTGRAARVRLQLPSGAWLLVHADVLRQVGQDVSKVAVVLEAADRAELLPVLLALHGLTDREREVCELLVAGHATDDIAARLFISRHTLRDHTKAIFAKVGVTSRPELTAVLGLAAVA
jgi:DNA-binding CsgD family transcriptional regulator